MPDLGQPHLPPSPHDKQAQDLTLTGLREAFLVANTPQPGGTPLHAAQALAEVALLLALPRPASTEDAEAQIAALQSASLRAYAAAHPAWAVPVMERVQQRLPDPAYVPDRQQSGAPWTPSAWRMYVALLLGSAA